jgi:hypothetical protein
MRAVPFRGVAPFSALAAAAPERPHWSRHVPPTCGALHTTAGTVPLCAVSMVLQQGGCARPPRRARIATERRRTQADGVEAALGHCAGRGSQPAGIAALIALGDATVVGVGVGLILLAAYAYPRRCIDRREAQHRVVSPQRLRGPTPERGLLRGQHVDVPHKGDGSVKNTRSGGRQAARGAA